MSQFVLSLFPGIGLLDRAFEEEGFTVVRGPDVLWGGDILRFHPPAGKFDGVIGGPPCQAFSSLANLNRAQGNKLADNLIPEFERSCFEAQPAWFLMENVPAAPLPSVRGYIVCDFTIRDYQVGGSTLRERRFSFGTADGRPLLIEPVFPFPHTPRRAITGDTRRASVGNRIRSKEKGGGVLPGMGTQLPLSQACEAQGLPADFLADAPFTTSGKRLVVGNGVPIPMGRAIAKAVKEAVGA